MDTGTGSEGSITVKGGGGHRRSTKLHRSRHCRVYNEYNEYTEYKASCQEKSRAFENLTKHSPWLSHYSTLVHLLVPSFPKTCFLDPWFHLFISTNSPALGHDILLRHAPGIIKTRFLERRERGILFTDVWTSRCAPPSVETSFLALLQSLSFRIRVLS